jgi:hypothetical protein
VRGVSSSRVPARTTRDRAVGEAAVLGVGGVLPALAGWGVCAFYGSKGVATGLHVVEDASRE